MFLTTQLVRLPPRLLATVALLLTVAIVGARIANGFWSDRPVRSRGGTGPGAAIPAPPKDTYRDGFPDAAPASIHPTIAPGSCGG